MLTFNKHDQFVISQFNCGKTLTYFTILKIQELFVKAWDSRFEGDRARQLWGGQFWQVEGHRCCRQGLLNHGNDDDDDHHHHGNDDDDDHQHDYDPSASFWVVPISTIAFQNMSLKREYFWWRILLTQELLGIDKAGSYSETTGGQGGAYNQEDKYEKEKRVSDQS